MASKNENSTTTQILDLILPHADFVAMMNDPDVLLGGGSVSSNQTFQLVLRKSNGTEIALKDMVSDDTLVVRFNKVNVTNSSADYGGVDVSA